MTVASLVMRARPLWMTTSSGNDASRSPTFTRSASSGFSVFSPRWSNAARGSEIVTFSKSFGL